MNVNDMLVFSEVVDRGGFTAAGEALGRPKSNVSRTVSRLEAALGVQLLERTTRKQTLTEVGRIYYQHCQRIKDELESASNSIENLTETPRGQLRVCASLTAGQSLFTAHLAGFARSYPDVKVDLRLTNRRVDLIEEGFDVVIRVGESPDSSLISKFLCSQELRFYCAPSYLKEAPAVLLKPDDLLDHQCLFMNAMNERARWQFIAAERTTSVEFTPAFSCDDFYVLQQLAIDGLGITLLPQYMVKNDLQSGRLVRVLEDWVGARVDLHTLVPSRRGMTPKIRAFLDYLGQACRAD